MSASYLLHLAASLQVGIEGDFLETCDEHKLFSDSYKEMLNLFNFRSNIASLSIPPHKPPPIIGAPMRHPSSPAHTQRALAQRAHMHQRHSFLDQYLSRPQPKHFEPLKTPLSDHSCLVHSFVSQPISSQPSHRHWSLSHELQRPRLCAAMIHLAM